MTAALKGQDELRRKFNELESGLQRKVGRKASRAGAKVIQPTAKRLAPVDEGTLQSQIKVRAMKRSRNRVGSMVTIDNTGPDDVFYGAFQEYGTKYITGQLFMTNAVNFKERSAIIVMRNVVRQEIMRLAR